MKKIDTTAIRNTILNWKAHDTVKLGTNLSIFTDFLTMCDLIDGQEKCIECDRHLYELEKLEPILSAARKFVNLNTRERHKNLEDAVDTYNKSLYPQNDE
jgi:hypothetical protein